ncbi:hypothetical protein PHMEG_00034988 [Phytophthora megakarya]|uniref:DUF659 domain-containing protein n=1 Tax=Phytophthora megakarya TaxID=4795 RepID=A0A225UQ77_9STRA|nr:hypothetical protein PHMEG_00034988 [Phytophthora megakarya]
MGHPASDEREQFINLGIDCGSNRTWHVCRHCEQAYKASNERDRTQPQPQPQRIKGRIENFRSHLKRCQFYKSYIKSQSAENVDLVQSKKKQTTIVEYFPEVSTQDERKNFEQILIEFQADNNLPDKFVERPSTFRLVEFILKAKCNILPLPKRKTMGGRILDDYSSVCETEDICKLRLCQKKLVAEPIFVLMLTYGLFKFGSRHDGLAIAENMENVMLQMEKDGWALGAVVTDNAGQCGRARRILTP